MDVVEYNTEYAQNAFGLKSGNRARKTGIYKCKTCGEEVTIWSDHNRLPVCLTCEKKVDWEYLHPNVEDVSQAGH